MKLLRFTLLLICDPAIAESQTKASKSDCPDCIEWKFIPLYIMFAFYCKYALKLQQTLACFITCTCLWQFGVFIRLKLMFQDLYICIRGQFSVIDLYKSPRKWCWNLLLQRNNQWDSQICQYCGECGYATDSDRRNGTKVTDSEAGHNRFCQMHWPRGLYSSLEKKWTTCNSRYDVLGAWSNDIVYSTCNS